MSEGIDYILDQVAEDIMGTNLPQKAYNAAKYMGGKVYNLQNDYNDFRQIQEMAKSYIQSPQTPSPYMQYANPDIFDAYYNKEADCNSLLYNKR